VGNKKLGEQQANRSLPPTVVGKPHRNLTKMANVTLSNNLTLSKCPHCKVDNPNLKRVHVLNTVNHQGADPKKWGVYQCQRCGRLVTAAAPQENAVVIEYYPTLDGIDDAIPSPARDYLEQANETIHAPSGSILLCASSIDSMLKIKGYEEGKLYTRINKAAKEHLITDGMSKWAHAVRLDANEQRHADAENDALPSIDDAKRTLEFVKALGQFLFVLPAKVEEGINAANPQQGI